MELAQAGSNIRGDVPVARVATECAAQLCSAPDANRAAAAPSAVLFRVRLAAVIADPLGSELCFSIPMLNTCKCRKRKREGLRPRGYS
jgi:hypothetical protein